jgi:hypothetical protein
MPGVAIAGCLDTRGGRWHGLIQLRCAFAGIRRKSRYVHKRRYRRIVPGLGDNGAAVAMTDQDHGPDCRQRFRISAPAADA